MTASHKLWRVRAAFPFVKGSLTVLAMALLGACAAPVTQRVSVSDEATKAEAVTQRELAVSSMVEEQKRLTRVYRTLATRAAAICGDHVGPNTGAFFMAKPTGEFGEVYRTAYGITDRMTVLFVLPDSPAETAGLKPRDVIHSINGISTADTEAVKVSSDGLPPEKPVDFVVSRNGELVSVRVVPEKACNYPARLDPKQDINASADGRQIAVARGMMSFARDDNELAIVIAHEMAHNVMKHLDARKQNMAVGFLADLAVVLLTRGQVSNSTFTQAGAMAYSQEFEAEADYVGLYILSNAGLPIADAPNFWRRMATTHPGSIKTNHSASHPSSAQRMVALTEAVKEIENKIQAKAPLLPNVKDGKFNPPQK